MQRQPLTLILSPHRLAVSRLSPDTSIPLWTATSDFVSITCTVAELSIVCLEAVVPDNIRCEKGWRCLRVAGTLDFSLTGILASLVNPLAQSGISVFCISTFDTDYLMVKEANLQAAITALQLEGHQIHSVS